MSAAARLAPDIPDILACYRAARAQWPTLAMVIILHGALFMMLIWVTEAPRHLALRPVMISAFIHAEEPAPVSAPPRVSPPKPQAPLRPEPVLAIAEKALPPDPAEPVEVIPEPPRAEPLTPVTPPEPAREAVPAVEPVVQEPAPPPVVPPRFDADYLDNPAPPYPGLSRKLGEQGSVLLRIYVDPGGSPARIELKQSSGYSRLDNVALNTVKRWRFVPARQGAAAIGGWVIVPISFKLRS